MFFCFLFKCTKFQLSGYTNKISLSAKEEKLPELSQNSTRYKNRHVLVTSEWYLAKCNNQEMQLVNVRPTILFPHLLAFLSQALGHYPFHGGRYGSLELMLHALLYQAAASCPQTPPSLCICCEKHCSRLSCNSRCSERIFFNPPLKSSLDKAMNPSTKTKNNQYLLELKFLKDQH